MMTTTENWTFGQTDFDRDFDTVEFWMTENGKRKCFRVEKNRLFVLGMKSYPELVDLTEMSESSSAILYELLTGSRRYSAQVTMNQAAEICHVATELKFTNLLKIMEKDLVKQTSKSMEQAVDSLGVALKFGMKEAVEKLVDEIVFGFLDEQFLMYCKSPKALEMVMKRKNELMDEQQQAPPTFNDQLMPIVPQVPQQQQNHQQIAVAPRVQQQMMHKVILAAAKEKFRTLMNRPINSFKNGIAWVSGQNLRRRRPQAGRNDDDGFEEFLDFEHFS